MYHYTQNSGFLGQFYPFKASETEFLAISGHFCNIFKAFFSYFFGYFMLYAIFKAINPHGNRVKIFRHKNIVPKY